MSGEEWYAVTGLREEGPGVVTGEIKIPGNSEWFSGHFPGAPILPGVALLDIVTDVFGTVARERGFRPAVTAVKRVKFKSPVAGEADLQLKITGLEDESSSFLFSFLHNDTEICRGQMFND